MHPLQISKRSISRVLWALAWGLTSPALLFAAGSEGNREPEEKTVESMVVTASGEYKPLLDQAGNTSRVDSDVAQLTRPTHSSQLLHRVPGTWITRGSGQESLASIRSPVLTGAGSCGAFLVAENSFPIRPAGFCNVNQLFEVNLEQADAVEVIRGPGSSRYGSNAMHGLINTLIAKPGAVNRFSIEAGQDNYWRGSADLNSEGFRALVNLLEDGGWRDQESYSQQKINLGYEVEKQADRLQFGYAASNLDQETAGYIYGENAYKDQDLRSSNLNPEAYRKADAQRLSGRWIHDLPGEDRLEGGMIVRHSDMEFLQHFLPGKPLERNGQNSIQASLLWHQELTRASLALGLDLELADGYLWQYQDAPIQDGSDYLIATRPAGKHYDYSVSSRMAAPFMQLAYSLGERTEFSAGLRVETLQYDYQNNMLDGNTDENGQPCGFGGCLYTRPADRTDRFTSLGPKLGVSYRLDEKRQVYITANRGFRAPQATELYRLQSQQEIAELEPETLDAIELGFRALDENHYLELAAFSMSKRNTIYRDSEGFNISGASTRHQGIELDYQARLGQDWRFALNGSWALHRYASDYSAPLGEQIISGNDIDTAPRTLGSARLAWTPGSNTETELEWQHTGGYYLDASNDPRYPGHGIFNLSLRQKIGRNWSIGLRITNLADRAYAERADYAFGDFRYFPGRGRAIFADISFQQPRQPGPGI